MIENSLEHFITGIPKAELHLHIEGTIEPEMMMEMADRHNIKLKYNCIDELKQAYKFNNLQEFLDIYYQGATVLLDERDFYDLTWAYLKKIHKQNVIHTEIFFDPQTHTNRGVMFDDVINGIQSALNDGREQLGISSKLIMSFLRHLDEEDAFRTLEKALPYKECIAAVGLDSSELGNPPKKFERVFEKARAEGFLTVAHAGEEGPADYIWEALRLLKISRIDHGNSSINDNKLVAFIADNKIPLTLCPLSNLALQVVVDLREHPLLEMMNSGMLVTLNSDDPAYFGGYLNENYLELEKALPLTKQQVIQLAKNSFIASFISSKEKLIKLKRVDEYCLSHT